MEPTLTPAEARAEIAPVPHPDAGDLPAPPRAAPSDEARSNTEVRHDEPPSAAAQNLVAEPSADSQSIGRIRLRKAERRPAEAASERLRPRAPSTRVDRAESGPPDSPRSLHEAFDSLDLDRLAESIRPAWETPASRRVTSPGDDPEVIVHYPSEWQPPPSERRRMRASWEVTPTLPLSFAPSPSDTLDDDWDAAPGDAAPASAQAPPPEGPAASEAIPDAPPKAAEPRILERDAAADSFTAVATEPVPECDARVGKSGGPGLESTAPTAVSQPAPVARRSSGAKLWGAGLAAAALVALVWRGSGSPTATPVAGADAAKSAANGEVAARAASRPASPPPAPAPAHAPAPAIAEDVEPASETAASAAPASASAAAAPPATPAAPPAPLTPAPLAEAPRASVARTPPRRHPPADEALARAAVAAPASGSTAQAPEATDAEQTGPDPRDVARALGTAAARARACSASEGSAANGSIRVLLNPSGGVLNATALGEFRGTSAGACVENAFRDAQTPAYQGRSLSTVYPFNLIVD